MTPLTLRVRELRKARGWSQRELARRADVRQATVSLLESGKAKKWDAAVLEKLAAALGCDPGYLIVKTRQGQVSEIETPRTWTDPNGRMWELSLIDPNIPAMSIPHDWPRDKLPVKPPHYQILFTDPFIPTNCRGVPYTSDKQVSQLNDQEITGYWKQVVAAYPDFAGGGYGTG